jgi:hypothetical protein
MTWRCVPEELNSYTQILRFYDNSVCCNNKPVDAVLYAQYIMLLANPGLQQHS